MSPIKESLDINGGHPPPASSETVPLAKIFMDPELQVRNKVDEATVKRYATAMEAGCQFPPVELARVDGLLYLVDGWHRVSAAYETNRQHIEANVTDMSMKEAAWRAAEANLRHGLPLKLAERRNVFCAYVKAGHHRKSQHRYKTYREMAEELHGMGGYTTIRSWMKKFHPKIFRAIGDIPSHRSSEAASPTFGTPMLTHIKQAMDTLVAISAAIDEPADRRWLIDELELMLITLKSGDVHPRLEEDECEF